VYVGEGLTLTPILTPEGSETTLTWTSDDEAVVRVSADGVLTGNNGTAPVYTLSGQRLAKPRKGLNIVGGKKVIVK
jgi:uncharacterized protein YjdB